MFLGDVACQSGFGGEGGSTASPRAGSGTFRSVNGFEMFAEVACRGKCGATGVTAGHYPFAESFGGLGVRHWGI